MLPFFTFCKARRSAFTLLFAVVCVCSSSGLFANTAFLQRHVKFVYYDDYISIQFLTKEAEGVYDELDNLILYYLDPSSGAWTKFFHGSYNGGVWRNYYEKSGWCNDGGFVWSSINESYKDYEGQKPYYRHISFYPHPGTLFNENIIIRADVQWDVDHNGMKNDGHDVDATFYYNTSHSNIGLIPWEDFSSVYYSRDYSYRVEFRYLLAETYGDGSVSSTYQRRHELDDIVVEYQDVNGDWQEIIHGDCDNSFSDKTFEVISKTSSGRFVMGDYAVGDRNMRMMRWYLPGDLQGRRIKFRYSYIWDGWANNEDKESDRQYEEFTVQTYTRLYTPSSVTLTEEHNRTYPKNTISWRVPIARSVDKFLVKRSTSQSDSEGLTVATVTVKNTNETQTQFSAVNSSNPDENESDDDKYLLAQGETYYYWVEAYYTGKTTAYKSDLVTSSAMDFTPQIGQYEISPCEENTKVKIKWSNIGSAKSIKLYKRVGDGVFNEIYTTENLDTYFVDDEVTACTEYTYKIEALSATVNGEEYKSTLEDDIILNADLSNVLSEFDVSKGYYDERVTLSWKNIGSEGIDYIKVIRKQVDNNAEETLDILESTASTYVDETALSGVYYQYSVFGEGKCGDTEVVSQSNILTSIGFCQRSGTIYGQITYEGGSAVEGVKIAIERGDNSASLGTSIQSGWYSNDYKSFISTYNTGITEDFHNGYTVEAWFKPYEVVASYRYLFHCSAFSLRQKTRDNQRNGVYCIEFKDVDHDFTVPQEAYDAIGSDINSFNHFAVSYDGDSIYVYVNAVKVYVGLHTCPETTGGISFASGYDGLIDEVRVWDKPKTQEEIENDFTRLLSGTEDGMLLYWRMDEGFGNEVYDMSSTNGVYNKNHGWIKMCDYSTDVPPVEYLSYCGLTNEDGYYVVDGIRYIGAGETFKAVPMMDIHEFEPQSRSMYLGNSALVATDKDFSDVSSFTVRGKIFYEETNFPVSNVFVKVDGQYVQGTDGTAVMSDVFGEYEVDVPIGEHYIQLEKEGHEFLSAFYPEKDDNGSIQYATFESPLDNVNFYDITKVKLIGKVVGGAVEAAKQTGSLNNPATNNIGQVAITLRSIANTYNLPNGEKDTTFYTDAKTGNFECELIPEIFLPVSVETLNDNQGIKYTFDGDADLTQIDLSRAFTDKYVEDSIYDVSSGSKMFSRIDTACIYNLERNWTYRETPQLSVTNSQGGAVFGLDSLPYTTTDGQNLMVEIASDNGDGTATYILGHPVFDMGNYYGLKISAFESYVNADDTSQVDNVPVCDGSVLITNNCAPGGEMTAIALGDGGEVNYQFAAGTPNLASPYTLGLDIKLLIGNSTYQWGDEALQCYVLGALPTGSNFVTKGPDFVDFILRDPPGSNSFAAIEEGTSFSSNNTMSASTAYSGGVDTEMKLGFTLKTSTGFIFSVGTEIEFENTNTFSFSATSTAENEISYTSTTTYNSAYSTSEAADYVGDMGDLFFGRSSNIIYGLARAIEVMRYDEILDTETIADSVIINDETYYLAQKNAMRFSPEVNTTFVYTQNHIEESLIPNLYFLRDLFYRSHTDWYTLNIDDDPEDERFLTDNDDVSVWGNEAVDNEHRFDGPSYTFTPPQDEEGNNRWDADTVRFYNQQIKMWEAQLSLNEQQKLSAINGENVDVNVSFDAGSSYEASITTEIEESSSLSYEFETDFSFSNSLGGTVNDFGFSVTLNNQVTCSRSNSSTNTTTSERTISYALADEDPGDYFSVDVLNCTAGNGPIFRTRGGQSSCPYEGASYTEYYQPGTILSEATMQIEQPFIRVSESLVTGVSEDEPAYFTIELSNTSETGDDGWYNLIVDLESNPYGATVKLDGMAMGANGKQILIPAGQTVYKTIAVTKGRTDIDEYDDIKLILHSQCQYDPTGFVESIYDEVTISAHFVPACSPIEISEPLANWVVNEEDEDFLDITLSGYNLQHEKMQAIALQYKAKSASAWTTEKWWVNNPDLINKDDIEDTLFIDDASSVSYEWDMSALSDREYEIRAVSYCDNEVNSYSEVMAGMLDADAPQLFGTPEPADGILSNGEDIAILFNEEIEAGLVTASNISVKGVLNGYETSHDVSVQLDGSSAYIESGEGIQLANRSFTIGFWLKIADFNTDGNIISYAYDGDKGLALEMENRQMKLTMNGVSRTFACSTNTTWHHYAIAYDNELGRMKLLQDDGVATNGNVLIADGVSALENNATLLVGANTGNSAFSGNIHDLRIWSLYRSASDVYADMSTILNGQEMGLMSYYRMNEAFGELLEDKASSRHALMNGASWLVTPTGKSYQFNGNNALLADITAIPITMDDNLSIEFWFKADNDARNSTLLSNGDPATVNVVDVQDILAFRLNEEGILELSSNGQLLSSGETLSDDEWHHIALVVKRTANAKLYVDGHLVSSVYGTDFGAFGGTKLAIGALKANIDDAVSDYFTGQIDEVRIWHSSRPTELLEAYRNARVASDDLGLRAYFPFETYILNSFDFYESAPSIDDQSFSIYDDKSYCNTDSVVGAQSFSDLTPNIKRQRELSEVNCDITINDDKIIITPTDADSKLENCLLEISVDGIYDKYENQMNSAVSWTAYVDQNTVIWTEDELELVKELNAELAFSTFIRNAGGTYENYSIENLPAWLDATPSSGIIAPDDEVMITFTVHSGLNIGSFNEDLYLKTDFGFDERMNIGLSVNGEQPEWAVNIGDMSETMSFISRVRIDGQLSKDEGDIVAVFAGDECRGVANVEYYLELDEYMMMLTVYGNINGEALDYRVYDASSGQIYTLCSVDTAFVAQMVYGSIANPVLFDWDELVKNIIPLQNGWNWISFNSTLDYYDKLDDVLANIDASSGDRIKDATSAKVSQYYQDETESTWEGTVGLPNNDVMYQCYIKNGGNLIYEGVPVSAKDHSICIEEGWNRISYIPSINLEMNEALSAYDAQAEDIIKSQLGFAVYTGFSWLGSLEYMEPGKGYMLKRAYGADTTRFNYPTASTFVSNKTATVDNNYDIFGLNPYDYESSGSVIARVRDAENLEAAYLMAYINDELRGATAVSDELMFVSIYGNEVENGSEVTFKIKVSEQEMNTNASIEFSTSNLYGTVNNPFEIEAVPTNLLSNNVSSQQLLVYPNPIKEVVNVAFVSERKEEVYIVVYNALGKLVYDTPVTNCETGENTLEWNASALPDGVYSLELNIGNQRRIIKICKVNQ